MTMPLERPAPAGEQFPFDTHVGQLCVFEVLEHVPPQMTKVSDKPQDSIRANVYVITPQGTVAEQFQNTLIWPRIVVGRLRQSVGKTVVGLINGQPGVKRDGKNVAYDLDDPSDPMMAAAAQAMAIVMQSRPAPQQQANGWGQQPAPQAGPWGQQQAAPPQQGPWGPQQGPPPGWGQQPPAQPPQQGPWGQQPLPTPPPDENVPPWERQQQPPAQAPWGGQQ